MASSLPGDDLQELEARQDPRLLRALDIVAPGTALREGIDNIVHSRTGGLIVIGDPEEVSFLFSGGISLRSEEHTSELQSHVNLVCRLLLEKKKPYSMTVL